MMPDCKHLNARVDPHELIGFMRCPDCGRLVTWADVINNMLDAMQQAIRSAHPQSHRA